jgi:hypothetical protein
VIVVLAITLLEQSSYCDNYGKVLAGFPIGQFRLDALGQCDRRQLRLDRSHPPHKSDWPEGTSSAIVATGDRSPWPLLIVDYLETACYDAPGNQD